MTNHLMIVRDVPFTPAITIIGKMWVPGDEEDSTNTPAFFEDSDFEEESFEDRVEDKMVKRGRRPARPTPTEGVETK